MPAIEIEPPLQRSLASLDEDALFWYSAFAPMLERMLYQSGLSPKRRAECLTFLASTVAPFMGPRPKLTSRRWRSFMTADHTPVESSLAWQWSNTFPRTRFAIDVVPRSGSEAPADTFYRTLQMGAHLRAYTGGPNLMNISLDLELFYFMAPRLMIESTSSEIVNVVASGASQSFFGFDIEESNAKVKAYFVPMLKSMATRKDTLSIISRMFEAMGHFEAWSAITSYVATIRVEERPIPFLVSIDCIPRDIARFKVYFRFPATTFTAGLLNLSLGNQVLLPKRYCEGIIALWDAVARAAAVKNSRVPAAQASYGLCLYYDFKESSTLPTSKLYIPVQSWAQDDLQITDIFSAWLEEFCSEDAAKNYLSLVSELCNRNLADGTGFHT